LSSTDADLVRAAIGGPRVPAAEPAEEHVFLRPATPRADQFAAGIQRIAVVGERVPNRDVVTPDAGAQ
jgi:hypothetical protein